MTAAMMWPLRSSGQEAITNQGRAMASEEKYLLVRNAFAYAVGVAAAIVGAAVFSPALPAAISFLASVGLGAVAWFAARRLLNPWTDMEREERRAARDYKDMLNEIAAVARRTAQAGTRWCIGRATAERLASIARLTETILERFRVRRDFAGASKALIVLQTFDATLSHYVKVKCNEIFIETSQAKQQIAQMEGRAIPLVEQALVELARKADVGECTDTEIHRAALEDILHSLDLMRHSMNPADSAQSKEEPDDT